MPLHAWSAATELAKLDRDFEDVLNHFMSPDWGVAKPYTRAHHPPAIESFIDADRLIVRADLPGVEPKDVEDQGRWRHPDDQWFAQRRVRGARARLRSSRDQIRKF